METKTAKPSDYLTLIEIWEASVRATHDFLPESDIQELKPMILEQYFDAVDLKCAINQSGNISGFCGVHDGNIEMLFIAPEERGNGVGSLLTRYAIDHQAAHKVDVNEKNPQALGFYQRLGFKVNGRSATDGQGKPYPIIHMSL